MFDEVIVQDLEVRGTRFRNNYVEERKHGNGMCMSIKDKEQQAQERDSQAANWNCPIDTIVPEKVAQEYARRYVEKVVQSPSSEF